MYKKITIFILLASGNDKYYIAMSVKCIMLTYKFGKEYIKRPISLSDFFLTNLIN